MSSDPQLRRHGYQGAMERRMVKRRTFAAIAFVMLLLLAIVGTGPLEAWIGVVGATQGDMVRQVLVVVIVGILLLGNLETAGSRPPMAVPFSLMLLLGYCLMSVSWAIDPFISVRRWLLTAWIIWIIVRAVGDLGAVRVLRIVRWMLALTVVASYLAVWLTNFGVHTADLAEAETVIGDWRGVLSHKNVAGSVCALTIIFFLFDRKRVPDWLAAAVIVITAFFLFETSSKTSMAVLALAVASGGVMRLYNPRHRSLVWPAALIGGASIIGVLLMYSGVIEEFLDDPGALTGRATIWPLLLAYASMYPWTGAGFGSFWQIGSASPILRLTNNWVSHAIGHGHNGYLDLLVTIGVPGLLLAIAVLFIWPAVRLLYSLEISRSRRALLTALLVFAAGHNLGESSLLERSSLIEVFLVIGIVLIHRLSTQSRGRHHRFRAVFLRFVRERQVRQLRGRLSKASGPMRSNLGRLAPARREAAPS